MTKSRMIILRLSLALLLLAPVVEASAALAGGKKKAYKPPTCGTAGQITDRGDGWTSIKMPELPPRTLGEVPVSVGAQPPRPLWPHPADPDVLFVTNGEVLMRTTDSGCTWTTVFEVPIAPAPDHPFSSVNSKIRSLAMSPQPSARGYVYMAVASYVPTPVISGVPSLRIYRSRDLGDSWEQWDQGLPEGLQIRVTPGIRVAPSDPDTVYLSTGPTSTAGAAMLYARTGASAAWEQRWWQYSEGASCVDSSFPCSGYQRQIHVDPRDPQVLWAQEDEGTGRERPLMRSRDGGSTWDYPLGRDIYIRTVDILMTPDGRTNLLVQPDWNKVSYVLRSKDGGETFQPLPLHFQGMKAIDDYPIYFGNTADRFILIEEPRSSDSDQGGSILQRYNSRARKWSPLGTLDRGQVVHYSNGQTHVFGTRPPPGAEPGSTALGSIVRYSGRF